jgi:hypothetical protein
LDQGSNEEFVADFLMNLAHANMGVEADPARTAEVAKQLVAYWKARQD